MRKKNVIKWLLCYWLLVVITLDSTLAAQCEYCEKDFTYINKHIWRCKVKLSKIQQTSIVNNDFSVETSETSLVNIDNNIPATNDPPVILENSNNIDSYTCYCGKKCKGLRGLQAHKRACRVVGVQDMKSLLSIEPDTENEEEQIDGNEEEVFKKLEKHPGIKLPKTEAQWERANDYFKQFLPVNDQIINTNISIKMLQQRIYKYFKDNYGTVSQKNDIALQNKYKDYSNKKLKKLRRNLKESSPDAITEIRFISKLLRQRLNKTNKMNTDYIDHQNEINKNFWKYCKNTFEKTERVQPNFDETRCYNFFKNNLKAKHKHKKFKIPPWMKTNQTPNIPFNTSPPTYIEINRIVSKMKASASPCPFDQVSVLILKKCPIIRTILWKIICKSWEEKIFPEEWKNSFTILAYKKGNSADPENYRPITLEPVMSKVYTAWMKNRMYKFLAENNLIDSDLQKGFWSNTAGTIEHTELMTHIINHARTKQKSLTISLIDLKNAFGEVHHNLLRTALEFHHIPQEMIDLTINLYTNYKVSIGTEKFITNPIRVNRGVLQGDSLSPLLFNMCFNTLMLTIKQEKLRCIGYIYDEMIIPRNWLQFADDTAIVTSTPEDNQLLLNLFTKWSEWAGFIIKVEKCHAFALKKFGTESRQYQPYLNICKQRVPPVKENESFVYLGKNFNFKMDTTKAKDQLKSTIETYLEKIDKLPLHQKSKVKIFNQYVISKIKWTLSIYQIGETWIKQNCDSTLNRYLRKWLNFHPGANVKHLQLPKKAFGLNLKSISTTAISSRISTRCLLKSSKSSDINRLYYIQSAKNINTDCIIEISSAATTKNVRQTAKKTLINERENSIWNEFLKLNKESIIITFLKKNLTSSDIINWQIVCDTLPQNIYSFCRRGLILALPTNANLHTWGQVNNKSCKLCSDKPATQHHILNNCSTAVNTGRYKWRHDSVLNAMSIFLSLTTSLGYKLFIDIPNFANPSVFFKKYIPDIILYRGNELTAIELTICFETNIFKSRKYKQNKYREMKSNLINKNQSLKVYYIEVTSLGFIKLSDELKTWFKRNGIDTEHLRQKLTEISIRASYYIFVRREKVWTNPALLMR